MREFLCNDLKHLIKLTPMNRTNRTQVTYKKKIDLNLAPTIIKCATILESYPIKTAVLGSTLPKTRDFPLDCSSNLKVTSNISVQEETAEDATEEETRGTGVRYRKNIYRSRKEKKSVLTKPKVKTKSKLFENNRLQLYYRNQIVSLISLLSKREYLFNILRGKNPDIEALPLKPQEIEEKLQKQLDGKGKDKTRKNFNHLTNEQLRSLKYKAKPFPYTKKDKGKGDD